MSNIYCSHRCIIIVLTCLVCATSSAQDAAPSAKQLYQEAAAAIRSADYKASIAALEQLLEHDDRSFVQVAKPHLAELYLATGNTAKAIKFAQECLSSAGTDASESVGDSTTERLQRVWLKAALQTKSLADRKQALQTVVALLSETNSPAATNQLLPAAVLGLIRTHVALAEFPLAQKLADEHHQLDAEIARLKTQLPLQAAKNHFANNRIRECDSSLAGLNIESLTQDDQIAARFLLLECSLRTGNWQQATSQSDWFDALMPTFSTPPSWAATLRLRQAELSVARRDYAKARETIQLAKTKHADFKLLYEFDFLAARIAIATIDFTSAETTLQQLANAHGIDSAAGIRARWMQGELEFMRRRYASAAAFYQQVANCDLIDWKPIGLLQFAKCQELLGEADKAIASYSLVLEHAGNSKEAAAASATATQQARRRIAALQSSVVPTR